MLVFEDALDALGRVLQIAVEAVALQVLREPLGELLLEELFQLVGVLVGGAVLLEGNRDRRRRSSLVWSI